MEEMRHLYLLALLRLKKNVLLDFAGHSLWSSQCRDLSISKLTFLWLVENLYLCLWSSDEKRCQQVPFTLSTLCGNWRFTCSLLGIMSCSLTFYKEAVALTALWIWDAVSYSSSQISLSEYNQCSPRSMLDQAMTWNYLLFIYSS